MALVIRLILIIDSACTILSSANNDSLTFSLQSLYLLIACSCLIALTRISSTVFKEVVMVGILSSFPNTGGKGQYFTIKFDAKWSVFCGYPVNEILFLVCWKIFILNEFLKLSSCLCCTYWVDYMLLLYSIWGCKLH